MGSRFTTAFSDFIVGTGYGNLPEPVIERAKLCILDFLGVALAGNQVGLTPLVKRVVCPAGGEEEATVIGEDRGAPAFNAALLNGVSGHSLDMDDGHRFANAHPASAVIPAAFAVAEKENAAGKDLIESVVAGYEIFIRIAKAMNPAHLRRGFHTTGTVGPFGAAAACSKLLRLDRAKVGNALSIAGLQGAGLLEVMASGQMMKPLHPGKAAQAGVLAALLAQLDAEGPEKIFEGDKGFFKAVSDAVDFDKLLGGIGTTYEILGTYFKMHAACRHVHPALDGLSEIMKAHRITVEEVERIDVSTYTVAYNLTGRENRASDELAAKFSIPVSVALMLVHGSAGVDQYSKECVGNPVIQKIADRVFVTVDPARDACYPAKRGAEILVDTKRGKFRWELEIPKGDPENPFAHSELREKFIGNATKAVSRGTALRIEELVMGDPSYSVRELGKLLRGSPVPGTCAGN